MAALSRSRPSAGAAGAAGRADELAAVRAATAQFHDFDAADDAGYGVFYVCTDETGQGAMGQHYVNGGLVGDAILDPRAPEAIMYEPLPGGGQRLVGVEWVVFKSAWEGAGHSGVAVALRAIAQARARAEPLRHPAVLPAPRLDLEAEPDRDLPGLEPACLVPRQRRLTIVIQRQAAGRESVRPLGRARGIVVSLDSAMRSPPVTSAPLRRLPPHGLQ